MTGDMASEFDVLRTQVAAEAEAVSSNVSGSRTSFTWPTNRSTS